jgi:putative ATP-dependent endonuclease of OLD family
VADADLSPQDVPGADEDLPTKETLNELEGPYVKVFLGATTFEREITLTGNLGMLAMAAADLGAPKLKAALELQIIDDNLKDRVLRTAKRFGKARFAQVASRHVEGATALPKYIRQAIEWLRGDK